MNNLEIHLNGQGKDYAELVQCKIDVVSYLRLVDRLAECLGGGSEAFFEAWLGGVVTAPSRFLP